ncbi:hypothetical protein ElyMa_003195400 [Elysia marginata]|uniref:Uncharacterized protein n=1 Tax=Elysia marginata TaxID=1093978 RepID=A0AAV4IYZ4_9GAST|nr:hypothetical protein ElyMa_003195400 [Elysia marginata]
MEVSRVPGCLNDSWRFVCPSDAATNRLKKLKSENNLVEARSEALLIADNLHLLQLRSSSHHFLVLL